MSGLPIKRAVRRELGIRKEMVRAWQQASVGEAAREGRLSKNVKLKT